MMLRLPGASVEPTSVEDQFGALEVELVELRQLNRELQSRVTSLEERAAERVAAPLAPVMPQAPLSLQRTLQQKQKEEENDEHKSATAKKKKKGVKKKKKRKKID